MNAIFYVNKNGHRFVVDIVVVVVVVVVVVGKHPNKQRRPLLKVLICPPSALQVNPDLKHHFEGKGLHFVGEDVDGERMEVIELEGESDL